jgi:hypothetical protein
MKQITADLAIDLLVASAIDFEIIGTSLTLVVGKKRIPFHLKVSQNSPTPSQITRDLNEAQGNCVIYVVQRLSSTLRTASMERGVAVAAIEDRLVLIEGREFRPLVPETRVVGLPKSSRRAPWARYALIRSLCRTRVPRTQAQLAIEIGATQAAVSQSLSKLERLVTKTSSGWTATDVQELTHRFLEEYPGAHGIGTSWYSLDPVTFQAQRAVELGSHEDALLSGDTAADLFAPWRVPQRAVVYVASGLDLSEGGFALTTSEKLTLELRVPADPTLWPTANAFADGHRRSTADPLIVAHDVLRTGGPDAEEAADRIVARLLNDWASS